MSGRKHLSHAPQANDNLDDGIDEDNDTDIGLTPTPTMDSGAQIRQAMELPTGQIFRASIEVFKNGRLNVVFAGSMNDLTVPLLNDIYGLKGKYDRTPPPESTFEVLENPKLLETAGDQDERLDR